MTFLKLLYRKLNVRKHLRKRGIELTRYDNPVDLQRLYVKNAEPLIFDVGAHSGNVTSQYLEAFPKAQIHAFEPCTAAFERLKNRYANDSRVRALQMAVCNRDGEIEIMSNTSPVTNSILKSDIQGSEYWGENLLETQSRILVPATTLDAYCRKEGIEHIDILKLDIQGAEYQALEGAADLLARRAVSLLFFEIITCPTYQNQRTAGDYFNLLEKWGYQFIDFCDPARRQGRLAQADFIFIKR